MKKLLLLLIIPLLSFGQDDCGKKPKEPKRKGTKKYSAYEEKFKIWEECWSKKGYDYGCRFSEAGKDEFTDEITYCTEDFIINSVSTTGNHRLRTKIQFIYQEDFLAIAISHNSRKKHEIENPGIYFLLDSNKIQLTPAGNSSLYERTITGTEKKLVKFNLGKENEYSYKAYAFKEYESVSFFWITREQLLTFSQKNVRKIRLSLNTGSFDITLDEKKSNNLLFDANCLLQAISKLYVINDYSKNVNNDSNNVIISNQNTNWTGNGSGFFLSSEGHIATNYHVIDGASQIEVEFKYNDEIKSFNAKLVNYDKINDLAIIKIFDDEFSNINNIPYNFKTNTVDVATDVFTLGFPMALTIMGKEIKFTDGKISSKTGFNNDITTYQIQVPVQAGNSGGPLFDFKGNLIGIISSTINREIGVENVNYAIKSSYLFNLIDVLPNKINLPKSTELASKKLTEKIKILSDYVVLIKIKNEKFSNECIQGNCIDGNGTKMYETGGKYVGEFKNGVRNGQGTYYYSYGDIYEGEWKKGDMHGQGTYYHANSGEVYVGEWWYSKRNGQGTVTNNKGQKVYEGEWKNDYWHGQGAIYDEGEMIYKGRFEWNNASDF